MHEKLLFLKKMQEKVHFRAILRNNYYLCVEKENLYGES